MMEYWNVGCNPSPTSNVQSPLPIIPYFNIPTLNNKENR
jgi:hypothetical protein